jgi:hypothetical protein
MHGSWCIQDDYLSHYNTTFPVCADITTTESQCTGRKRGRSDPEGTDSEPGKCQLISVAHLQLSLILVVTVSHCVEKDRGSYIYLTM